MCERERETHRSRRRERQTERNIDRDRQSERERESKGRVVGLRANEGLFL